MSFGRLLVAAALLIAASPAAADVVFPARLLLTEVERGTYAVVFTLPILEGGRKLRAEPSLPPSCRDETEREIETTSGSFTERWRSVCEPASLAGEAVLIEGLLGTQTEILVEIRTHDGRLYSELLKPSRPGLIVPEPPSWLSLAAGSAIGGVRRIVTYTELCVLLLVATCLGMPRRSTAFGIVAFAAAHALGQWAAARNGLLVSPHIAPTFVLLTALVSAIRLARDDRESRVGSTLRGSSPSCWERSPAVPGPRRWPSRGFLAPSKSGRRSSSRWESRSASFSWPRQRSSFDRFCA